LIFKLIYEPLKDLLWGCLNQGYLEQILPQFNGNSTFVNRKSLSFIKLSSQIENFGKKLIS